MQVSDILSLEENNADSINLLKEGIFWRSYNRSAMRLCACLRAYKVNMKYIKKVKQEICFCGFPDTFLHQLSQEAKEKGYQLNQITEKHIAINNIPGDTVAYDEWKNKYHNENDATFFQSISDKNSTPNRANPYVSLQDPIVPM